MNAYKEFTKNWLFEVRRVFKDSGTICLISGMQSIYEIGNILRELGFWVLNDIIWYKSNPTPNFQGTRLNNSHETLIWASKSKNSKFTFNYKTGKHMNNCKQMGSVWTFPVCSGGERLKDENGQKVHNTQKPENLLYRIICLFTKPGDLVLDLFAGTMTTACICKKTGRNYTMIEKDANYIKYGKERLENQKEEIGDIENAVFDIKPLKVSFEEMVKNNYFIIDEKFYNKNQDFVILIDEKGKLEYNNEILSMHVVAALMNKRNGRMNAFDHLYVLRNNELVSIDKIRNNYRYFIENNIKNGGFLSSIFYYYNYSIAFIILFAIWYITETTTELPACLYKCELAIFGNLKLFGKP